MAKWIHFTGICGTATGQLAVEFKRNGYLVSGSEKGLYPPMSEHVISNGINIEIGYKPEHLNLTYYQQKYKGEWLLHTKSFPDEVIFVGTKGSQNPEYIFAKDNQMPIKFYPQVLKEMVVKPGSSIVVAGTYAKTTITSMLAWIFIHNGIDVSYMFGGLNPNLKNGVRFRTENTIFSIIEGDEYMISLSDQRSKFFEYAPDYLILTSAQWDHTDMFKTREEYLFNFKALVDSIPEHGVIIYDDSNTNLREFVITNAKAKLLPYSNFQLMPAKDNLSIDKYFNLKILGEHNQKNALAAYAMALTVGVDAGLNQTNICDALSMYLGLRRRLEIKYRNSNHIIIDDFGSTPHKARVAVNSLAEEFPHMPIFLIFEPNLGSRTARIMSEYQNTFNHTSIRRIFLPRFTNAPGDYLNNTKMSEYLKLMQINSEPVNDDNLLIESIVNASATGGIVIFMGSHGFRGMIEKVTEKIQVLS